MRKFKKNREVSPTWLNVPIKYMLKFTDGANVGSRARQVPMTIKEDYEDYLKNFVKWDDDDEPSTFEEYKAYKEKWLSECSDDEKWLWQPVKDIPAKHDKTFCIIEMSKRWAICGWRNNERCSIGMPIKCPIVKRNRRTGIIYKDKFYPIDGSSGWVF